MSSIDVEVDRLRGWPSLTEVVSGSARIVCLAVRFLHGGVFVDCCMNADAGDREVLLLRVLG